MTRITTEFNHLKVPVAVLELNHSEPCEIHSNCTEQYFLNYSAGVLSKYGLIHLFLLQYLKLHTFCLLLLLLLLYSFFSFLFLGFPFINKYSIKTFVVCTVPYYIFLSAVFYNSI